MVSPQNFTSKEDKLFFDKLADWVHIVQKNWTERFSFFLDQRQQAAAEYYLSKAGFSPYAFYGGYGEAQRKVLGLFLEYSEPEENSFPVQAVTLRFKKEYQLRHQDILGSLMALEIKRELVGDILVDEGIAVVFCLPPANHLIMNELEKVGRVGVQKEEGRPQQLPQGVKLLPITGTVSSMRLDCVIAFLANISREKSAALIKSGAVSVNFFENKEVEQPLKEKDILSVRGYGRYEVTQIGGATKKGRLHLTCSKYV